MLWSHNIKLVLMVDIAFTGVLEFTSKKNIKQLTHAALKEVFQPHEVAFTIS